MSGLAAWSAARLPGVHLPQFHMLPAWCASVSERRRLACCAAQAGRVSAGQNAVFASATMR